MVTSRLLVLLVVGCRGDTPPVVPVNMSLVVLANDDDDDSDNEDNKTVAPSFLGAEDTVNLTLQLLLLVVAMVT